MTKIKRDTMKDKKILAEEIEKIAKEEGVSMYSRRNVIPQLWYYMQNVLLFAYLARKNDFKYEDSEQSIYEFKPGESEQQVQERMWDAVVARYEASKRHTDEMMIGVNLWGIVLSLGLGCVSVVLTLLSF